MEKLQKEFFMRNGLELAPALCGKLLCRRLPDGKVLKLRVTETEAYMGTEDTACHAYKGKTPRTEMLWHGGGTVYIYLCYGMHWMLNVVSGDEGDPQGVLIRACEGYAGPGKLTKYLQINKELNGKNFGDSEEIWFEDDGFMPGISRAKRVGIDYAQERDRDRLWRFISQSTSK